MRQLTGISPAAGHVDLAARSQLQPPDGFPAPPDDAAGGGLGHLEHGRLEPRLVGDRLQDEDLGQLGVGGRPADLEEAVLGRGDC